MIKTQMVVTTFHFLPGLLNHEFISEVIAILPYPNRSLRLYVCITTLAYISESDMKRIVLAYLDTIALIMPHIEFPIVLTGGDNVLTISVELANV
jgi:hypothetical protein